MVRADGIHAFVVAETSLCRSDGTTLEANTAGIEIPKAGRRLTATPVYLRDVATSDVPNGTVVSLKDLTR